MEHLIDPRGSSVRQLDRSEVKSVKPSLSMNYPMNADWQIHPIHSHPVQINESLLFTPPNLPAGTLTFMLTDIEGSTRLWEQQPDQMRAAMARHDELIESAVNQHRGNIIRPRGEGDSRFAVFSQATDAVAAAVAIQAALTAEPWGTRTPLKVRIGMHTGEADLRDGDYYGTVVNRCARLRSVAYGGQILISQITQRLVQEILPEGVSLLDMGEHNLKDLSYPEHIYQVVVAGLDKDFPPLRTALRTHSNLPEALTRFIGREHEIKDVNRLLSSTRLLTITGPGGAGKTRLAIEVASQILDTYEDGIWWIDLAALSNPELAVHTMMNVIGVREETGYPATKTFTDFLRGKHMLIILDNCEHLLQGVAPLIESLLRATPNLQVLATSREALNVPGEISWRIPSLSSPGIDEMVDLDRLMQYEAVKLFVDRARAVRSDFTMTHFNALAVAQICARLDGIPLAIELAAARVRVLSVQEIAARLNDRFHLLVGNRTAIPRQQTLRALIDWSYDLLSETERVMLRRLSIFAGSWTLDAAEEVCSGGMILKREVLDLLMRLVDKSLVMTETRDNQERYRFLETILQYSREGLAESREANRMASKHAAYYLKMAEESYGELWGPKQGYWLVHLEIEHDNLREALVWMKRNISRKELFLRLSGSLWRFWEIRGYISEGRAWLDAALERNPDGDTYLRANGLRGAGNLARQQGDYEQARAMHEQSLALFRELGYELNIARQLDVLGEIALYQGNYSEAIKLHNESLAIRYEIGDKEGIAISLRQLAVIERDHGNYQHSQELLEKSLSLSRELGDKLLIASSLNNLGLVDYLQCEYERSMGLFEQALSLFRELNDQIGISNVLQDMGKVAKDQGEYKLATILYNECLELKKQLGDKRGVAQASAGLAEVAFHQGNYPLATELARQSLFLSQQLGYKRGIISSLEVLAFTFHFQGDYRRARSLGRASQAMSKEIESPRAVAYTKELLGLGAYAQGDLDKARKFFIEAQDIFCEINDLRNLAITWINLARTAYRQGDDKCAWHFLEESLSISRELNIRWTAGFALEIMGLLQRKDGNYDGAFHLFMESLQMSVDQANQQGIANCLGALAGLAVVAQQPRLATRLFAAADKIRQAFGAKMGHDDQVEYESYLNKLRNQLEKTAFEEAWSEGHLSTWEQTIEILKDWVAGSSFQANPQG